MYRATGGKVGHATERGLSNAHATPHHLLVIAELIVRHDRKKKRQKGDGRAITQGKERMRRQN